MPVCFYCFTIPLPTQIYSLFSSCTNNTFNASKNSIFTALLAFNHKHCFHPKSTCPPNHKFKYINVTRNFTNASLLSSSLINTCRLCQSNSHRPGTRHSKSTISTLILILNIYIDGYMEHLSSSSSSPLTAEHHHREIL